MNLVKEILQRENPPKPLPHMHELVNDKASDLDGQQWAQLTAALQSNVDLFFCPGQT